MIITCINCNTKYSINKQSLGKKGKKVKCSNCGHEWFQKSEITKKKLKIKPLEEEQAVTDNNKEIYSTKIFSQEKTKKKKNYNFLYLFILIILIFFIYLNKEYFINGINNYFFKFIKKEFLVNDKTKNSSDLIFNHIEKEVSILNNNQRVIKIFGKISNVSNIETYQIPKIQATLLDDKNNIIETWYFYADQENLVPNESINFHTSYINDDQNFDDIKIEFYKELE